MADAASAVPSGWTGVWGFMDGLGGAVDRLGGIVNTVADGAEDVARGRDAIAAQRDADAQRDLDLALQLAGFDRGDNETQMWVIGAAAVALIVIFAGR